MTENEEVSLIEGFRQLGRDVQLGIALGAGGIAAAAGGVVIHSVHEVSLDIPLAVHDQLGPTVLYYGGAAALVGGSLIARPMVQDRVRNYLRARQHQD